MSLFAVPAGAATVLRRLALGIDVEEDRMQSAAKLLPPGVDENTDDPSDVHLLARIEQKVEEIKTIPEHFILNDKLWPQYPNKI
jgi:hypothetical protein